MKRLFAVLPLCFGSFAVDAAALKVVNVSAPAINCVFNPACTVAVNDTTDNVALSAGGIGFLQSRTYRGAPGSPAAGLYAYEYRIDLRNALAAVAISCIDSMTITFGPVVGTVNYDRSAEPDQVFVVTGGGLGTVGLASAIQTGSKIKFNFAAPICAGGAPGKGDSTFFWGLVSKTPPKAVNARLRESGGASHTVKARAPK